MLLLYGIDIISIVIWELYVGITNIYLKWMKMDPDEFKYGLLGWSLFIEVPRIIGGFLLINFLSQFVK